MLLIQDTFKKHKMAPLGEGIGDEWKSKFLAELSTRPSWLTEVRRDGKDAGAVTKVIINHHRFNICLS